MGLHKNFNLAPQMQAQPHQRAGLIISDQGALWKCPVCHTYNPIGVTTCKGCQLKNPAMLGGPF